MYFKTKKQISEILKKEDNVNISVQQIGNLLTEKLSYLRSKDYHSFSDYDSNIGVSKTIKKKDNVKHATDVGLYTKSYGGQIHFDIFGIKKERKIIGLSGFAGQNILIDLDNKRIIVISSLYRNYDWKKIVYKKIKNIN